MRELHHGRGCVPMMDSHELSEWEQYFKLENLDMERRKGASGGGSDGPIKVQTMTGKVVVN